MDVQRLRTFRSVVACGSVRGAAGALGYSPASVSSQIGQLQRETGLILFARAGRGVEPTQAGLALAQRAGTFLEEVADLDRFITGLREGQHGSLVIAYFSSLGAAWMPGVLARLTEDLPGVSIDLIVRDAFDPQAKPSPDVQLVAEASPQPHPSGYQATRLTEDPYVAVVPSSHPLAREKGAIRLDALAEENWIDTNAGQGTCRQVALDACTAAGFRPDLGIQAQDYATALAMVAAGLGISVIPRIGAAGTPPGVTILAIQAPTPTRHISALIANHSAHTPSTKRTIALLKAAARTTPR